MTGRAGGRKQSSRASVTSTSLLVSVRRDIVRSHAWSVIVGICTGVPSRICDMGRRVPPLLSLRDDPSADRQRSRHSTQRSRFRSIVGRSRRSDYFFPTLHVWSVGRRAVSLWYRILPHMFVSWWPASSITKQHNAKCCSSIRMCLFVLSYGCVVPVLRLFPCPVPV